MTNARRKGWIDAFSDMINDWPSHIKDTSTIEATILAPQNNALVSQHFNKLYYFAFKHQHDDKHPRIASIAQAILNGLFTKWLQDNHNSNRNMKENFLVFTLKMLEKIKAQLQPPENTLRQLPRQARMPTLAVNSRLFAPLPASAASARVANTAGFWAQKTKRLNPDEVEYRDTNREKRRR